MCTATTNGSARLEDQARTLEELLHAGISYPRGATVLEAGCGVGAQTVPLARNSPGTRITSVDISEASLDEARARVAAAGLADVALQRADIFPALRGGVLRPRFPVLRAGALAGPRRGVGRAASRPAPGWHDHGDRGRGSTLFHPDSDAARAAIRCRVASQRWAGGDALIGRRLYPLLRGAGFDAVRVSPRVVYVDAGRPALVDGFIRRTFTAMVEGVRTPAIAAGLIGADAFDAGIQALHRTTEPDGVFCYTFFKAAAIRA